MAIFNDGGVGQSDRSAWDRKRHRQLVEDAIRKNMGDIIAEESIIGQSKSKKIKIPIRGLKEYQFVYGKNNGGTASGSGKEKKARSLEKSTNSNRAAEQVRQATSQAKIFMKRKLRLMNLSAIYLRICSCLIWNGRSLLRLKQNGSLNAQAPSSKAFLPG